MGAAWDFDTRAEQGAAGAHHPTWQGSLGEPDGGGAAAHLQAVEHAVEDIAEDSLVLGN